MDDFLKLLPAKYLPYGTVILVLVPMLGRAYHALAAGTGLVGVFRGILFGTNAPKDALTPSEAANLRATVIKDVPAGQPVPVPTAPVPVQQNKLP